MSDGFAEVPVVSLLAVVTVPTGRMMATLDADSAAFPTGQQVELLVEATMLGMKVTVASCKSISQASSSFYQQQPQQKYHHHTQHTINDNSENLHHTQKFFVISIMVVAKSLVIIIIIIIVVIVAKTETCMLSQLGNIYRANTMQTEN